MLLLSAASAVKAQVKLSGKITDTKNKPVAGASITLKDSYDGATSDSSGKYSFMTSEKGEKTIQVTIIGYKPFEQKLTIAGSPIVSDISLKELITELKAVVISAGSFEAGDKNLKSEKSQALELSLRHKGALGQGSVGVFLQDYRDYIALAPTGTPPGPSGLPHYAYFSTDARFYGAELDYKHNISHLVGSGALEFEVKFDWLKGVNRSTGDNLPRVTPMRETIALIRKADKYQTDIELQRIERQRDTAPNETSTGDYLLVNLGYERPLTWERATLSFFARVNNVFDVEARNHISVIKDAALLPGRNFLAGVQATF